MQRLFPDAAAEVDLPSAYAIDELPSDASHLRLNMITSLDGAVRIEGRAGPLGGAADRDLFRLLRSLADVVLVGAETIRAEHYGPVRLSAEQRDLRRQRGQAEIPPMAVMSRTGNFDWSTRFFTEAEVPPLVLTGTEGMTAEHRSQGRAEFIPLGDEEADVPRAVEEMRLRGMRRILCEGGPRLNAQLREAGLVDEICLTLAPTFVGRPDLSVFGIDMLHEPQAARTTQILEEDGFLFLRLSLH